MFQAKVVEKTKRHILYSVTFFDKSAVYQIIWKNTLERDNMVHAHCMLDT